MNGHRAVAATMAVLIVTGAGCTSGALRRAAHHPANSAALAQTRPCSPALPVHRRESTPWPSRTVLRESPMDAGTSQVVDPAAGAVFLLAATTNTPERGPWVLCQISLATGAVRLGQTFRVDDLAMAAGYLWAYSAAGTGAQPVVSEVSPMTLARIRPIPLPRAPANFGLPVAVTAGPKGSVCVIGYYRTLLRVDAATGQAGPGTHHTAPWPGGRQRFGGRERDNPLRLGHTRCQRRRHGGPGGARIRRSVRAAAGGSLRWAHPLLGGWSRPHRRARRSVGVLPHRNDGPDHPPRRQRSADDCPARAAHRADSTDRHLPLAHGREDQLWRRRPVGGQRGRDRRVPRPANRHDTSQRASYLPTRRGTSSASLRTAAPDRELEDGKTRCTALPLARRLGLCTTDQVRVCALAGTAPPSNTSPVMTAPAGNHRPASGKLLRRVDPPIVQVKKPMPNRLLRGAVPVPEWGTLHWVVAVAGRPA
jgi:hypothetical protein